VSTTSVDRHPSLKDEVIPESGDLLLGTATLPWATCREVLLRQVLVAARCRDEWSALHPNGRGIGRQQAGWKLLPLRAHKAEGVQL
jgi:hypothetical protein